MPLVNPNDIIYRADVFGVCHSRKCAGAKRIGAYVVYGNGDEVVRCKTCNSKNDFYMSPGQSYNVGSRYGNLGENDPDKYPKEE